MSTTTNNRSTIVDLGEAGALRVMFHGNGLATVSTYETGEIEAGSYDKRRASGTVTVNRVEYYGSLTLHRDASDALYAWCARADETGYLDRGSASTFTRHEWRQGRDDRPSDSARGKLRELCEKVAAEALAADPSLELAGEKYRTNCARESLTRDLADLEEKAADVRTKLAELGE